MVVRHAMGKNWSAFYEGMLRGVFEDGLNVRLDVSIAQKTCLASFQT
jgi:hypothetical protein